MAYNYPYYLDQLRLGQCFHSEYVGISICSYSYIYSYFSAYAVCLGGNMTEAQFTEWQRKKWREDKKAYRAKKKAEKENKQ